MFILEKKRKESFLTSLSFDSASRVDAAAGERLRLRAEFLTIVFLALNLRGTLTVPTFESAEAASESLWTTIDWFDDVTDFFSDVIVTS